MGLTVPQGMRDAIFNAATAYDAGYAPNSVAIADVNGDGNPDLLVANLCAPDCINGGLSVLLGNGDGTFQPPVSYSSGGYNPWSVAVADVNGDGRLDILVANYCSSSACIYGVPEFGNVGVLLGNGDGTFQPVVSYSSGGDETMSVSAGDVNGDGNLDLLVVNGCLDVSGNCPPGRVGVLLGNGDGTFQAAVTYDSGQYAVSSVAVADLNRDGIPDLVIGNSGGAAVLLGMGKGIFQPAVEYSSGGLASSVALADVNSDGRLDIVLANYCATPSVWNCTTGGTVGVLLGNGDGTFQAAVTYESLGDFAISIVVADVNGDGTPDLLVDTGSGVGVLLGVGDGSFQAAKIYSPGERYPGLFAVGDINRDGRLDLVEVDVCSNYNCSYGSASVMLGGGDGTFQAAVFYRASLWGMATDVTTDDVNGDGRLDLVVASCSSPDCHGSVDVLLGNGDGTFQPAVSYSSGDGESESVVVGDVNRDGHPDLVVATLCQSSDNCINGGLSVLLGNGDGTFQPPVSYSSGGYWAYSVAVADVNGDGRLDILVANYCSSIACRVGPKSGNVGVLLGNGDGTFQAAVTYSSGDYGTNSVSVSDVNGDGKSDLLVANVSSVGVLLGNGNGTFQPVVTYDTGGYDAYSVAVGDLNGDGKLDLVANELSNVDVLLGNGDGTFQPALTTTTYATDIGRLVLDDFNGDGKLDVASGVGNFLLLGNGDGSFQPSIRLGDFGFGIAVGDFNGDGKPDLAAGGVAILLNIATNFHYATTTVVTSSLNPAPAGQSVTFTASVTPAFNAGLLAGSVTFYDGAIALGTVAICNGHSTFKTSSLAGGTHSITASYSGDTKYLASTSAALTETVVTKATTTTTLVSSMNPSVQGKPVAFTAAVSSLAGTPTGKVQFLNGTKVLASKLLTSGSAKYTTSTLPPGANSITAVYLGDSKNNGSTSAPVNQFVLAATTTTLKSSPNPSVYGQTVVFTAKVTSSIGAPPDGETVTFKQGATVLGTGTLSGGKATFSISTLGAGTKAVTAVYAGDANFATSTSKAVSQVIGKAKSTTTLTSSKNHSTYGQPVTFTATVTPQFSGTPTGTVVFKDGTKTLKTATLSGGVASYTTSTLPHGTHTITATYNGSTSFYGSSASLTQTVN